MNSFIASPALALAGWRGLDFGRLSGWRHPHTSHSSDFAISGPRRIRLQRGTRPPVSYVAGGASATRKLIAVPNQDNPRAMTKLPERSRWKRLPGGITVVALYSVTMAGPR